MLSVQLDISNLGSQVVTGVKNVITKLHEKLTHVSFIYSRSFALRCTYKCLIADDQCETFGNRKVLVYLNCGVEVLQ